MCVHKESVLLIFQVECNQYCSYAVLSLVGGCLFLCLVPVFLALVYKLILLINCFIVSLW